MTETLVIDTHIWIWLMEGDASLNKSALAEIETAAQRGQMLVPVICVWEVAMLARRGRIVLTEPVSRWVTNSLSAPGLSLAPLTPEIAIDSCHLPAPSDGVAELMDPADRVIVATARIENATLVTRDKRMVAYGDAGHLPILAA